MTSPMLSTDMTATLQAALDAAAAARAAYTVPPGGHRLLATGLGYASNARIIVAGDLYNDHGPAVGTHYCLTNRSGGRVSNVTIIGAGGAFVGSASDPAGATRKGLGIVATDGFTVIGVATAGPLTGFGMEIKNSSGGHINGLALRSGVNRPGADGLHFFGACSRVTGSGIVVRSGDDALSFTAENHESIDAVMERITLTTMTLDSAAFSCIKFFTSPTTGRAAIRKVTLTGIKGRITEGPTGCPLIMQNTGAGQGCVIEDITIANADLDFGAATQDGPTAYLTDCRNVTLRNVTLRGRRNGQFLRAIRCTGLRVTGEVWDTIPGNSMNDLVQLEYCSDYDVNLIVRSATGARIGTLRVRNAGADTGIRYIGMTGS
ncbi:hypothetical protein DC429_12450 [Arthrobacter sp. TPD3018]|uniref:hypothetical protein n=1 Tax=Bacteria TaxID=2 RepID=UPI000D51D6C9|nr:MULTISPECIES: hypothetical protein [Bacteria]PVE53433.1 hypothetical protein DC425_13540 [Sphingomonas sp. TPD3009]PVE56129.1 hypothetical protein DC429_12450 [Arthrobacter sp. TPD3018]PVE81728.1 hypothetical protein DC431_13825 [Sphingomonas melonis]